MKIFKNNYYSLKSLIIGVCIFFHKMGELLLVCKDNREREWEEKLTKLLIILYSILLNLIIFHLSAY